ncbi:MAG: nitrogen regulation protein NR(II) [Steroidobacteraceae bacterium]
MAAEPSALQLPRPLAHLELLDSMTTGVVVVDAALNIVTANLAAQDVLAVSLNAMRGRSLRELVIDGDGLMASIERSAASGATLSEREFRLVSARAPGNERIVDIVISSLGPEEAMVLLEITNATERQRIARENELLARIVSGRMMVRQLAHEVKNPLGGLRGAAQLLERELADPALREYTQVIISEADRLAALVDSMSGPAAAPRKQLSNLHEICEHVFRLVRAETRGQILMERDYDPSLPDAMLDPAQIVQALINVLRNAIQALGERGRVILRSRALPNCTIGATRHRLVACLQVEDNGCGVPDELRDSIFLPLVTGRSDGTGLGLSLAQELLTRHDGLIEFESAPGRTVFTLLLPISQEAQS